MVGDGGEEAKKLPPRQPQRRHVEGPPAPWDAQNVVVVLVAGNKAGAALEERISEPHGALVSLRAHTSVGGVGENPNVDGVEVSRIGVAHAAQRLLALVRFGAGEDSDVFLSLARLVEDGADCFDEVVQCLGLLRSLRPGRLALRRWAPQQLECRADHSKDGPGVPHRLVDRVLEELEDLGPEERGKRGERGGKDRVSFFFSIFLFSTSRPRNPEKKIEKKKSKKIKKKNSHALQSVVVRRSLGDVGSLAVLAPFPRCLGCRVLPPPAVPLPLQVPNCSLVSEAARPQDVVDEDGQVAGDLDSVIGSTERDSGLVDARIGVGRDLAEAVGHGESKAGQGEVSPERKSRACRRPGEEDVGGQGRLFCRSELHEVLVGDSKLVFASRRSASRRALGPAVGEARQFRKVAPKVDVDAPKNGVEVSRHHADHRGHRRGEPDPGGVDVAPQARRADVAEDAVEVGELEELPRRVIQGVEAPPRASGARAALGLDGQRHPPVPDEAGDPGASRRVLFCLEKQPDLVLEARGLRRREELLEPLAQDAEKGEGRRLHRAADLLLKEEKKNGVERRGERKRGRESECVGEREGKRKGEGRGRERGEKG